MNNMVPINTSAGPARNGGHSRAYRRRLMALLRLAHSVLGMKRKRLALGISGIGGSLAVAAVSVALTSNPASAQGVAFGIDAFAFDWTAIAIGGEAKATVRYSTAIGVGAQASESGATAIGADAKSSGTHAIAFGSDSKADGLQSIAFGAASIANGENALSLGTGATIIGSSSLALGSSAGVKGDNSIGIGSRAKVTADGSIAIGAEAEASGDKSTALGAHAIASKQNSMALGDFSNAAGAASLALGFGANASAEEAIAIGRNASATGYKNIAIGSGAKADADGAFSALAIGVSSEAKSNAVAIGLDTSATNESVAIGRAAKTTGVYGTAVGVQATAGYQGSALGSLATASGDYAIAIGLSSEASSRNAVAIGRTSIANNLEATALGYAARATGDASTALGYGSKASGQLSLAAGGANASSTEAIAIGNGATSSDGQTVAIGAAASAVGQNAIAMGNTANAAAKSVGIGYKASAGSNSIAIGSESYTYSTGGIALGTKASAAGFYSIAIGDNSSSQTTGSVALGNNSVAGAAVAVANTTIAGAIYGFAGITPTSVLSVGKAGAERQIANVAAGRLLATSTDAINGSQLFASNQAINLTNVRIDNINSGDDTSRVVIYDGAVGDDKNLITLQGGASGTRISNLKAGSLIATSTDAVNGSQLNSLGTSIANVFGSPATFDTTTGAITGASFTVGGNTYNTIGGAITSIDNSISQVSNTFLGAGYGVTKIVGNNSRDYEYGNYQVDGSGKITNPSVTYVPNTIGTANAQVVFDAGNGSSTYFAGHDRDNGLLPTGTRLSNVADAREDTDALNLGQFMDYVFQGTIPGQNNLFQQTSLLRSGNGMLGAGPGSSGIINSSDLSQGYTSAPFYSQFTGSYQGRSAGSTVPTDKSVARGNGAIALGSNAQTAAGSSGALAVGVQSYAKADDSVALGSGSVSDEANTISVGSSGKTSYEIVNGDNSRTTVGTVVNTRRIVNMAAGFNNTDAVNVSQLKGITDIIGGGSTIDGDGNVVNPTYTIGGNTYTTIAEALDGIAGSTGGDALQWDTVAGAWSAKHGATPTNSKITNLADGELSSTSTDAVTGKQLNDTNTNVTNINNNINNGTVGPVQRTATADKLTLVATGGTAAAPGNAQVISNLANGSLTATSSEAVNGSQINTLASNISDIIGGGSSFDPATGKIKDAEFTVGGNTYTNIGDTFGAVDSSITNIDNSITNITKGKAGPVQRTATADKLTLVADGKNATDPGNAQVLGNLANGSLTATSSEAVNGSQINTLASNISDIIGGGSSFDPTTGKIKDAEFTVGGNTYNNIGDTFGAVDSSITNIDNSITNITKGKAGPVQRTATADQLTLVADGGTAAAPGNAQVIGNLANGTVNAASKQAVNGSQLYGVSNSIAQALGGGSSVNTDGTVKKPTYNIGGTDYTDVGQALTALDGVTANLDAPKWDETANGGAGAYSAKHGGTNAKLTNLADGTLSTTSTDAVTGKQLNTTNTNVTNVTNQVSNLTTNITEGKVGPLQRTATADKLTLVADGSDADAPGNAQVIDNLAKGTVNTASKQAVNGSQLYGVSNSVAVALGGGSGVNTDGTVKKPTYNIGGTDYTDVGSALTALDDVTVNLDAPKWDAAANGGAGAWSAKHNGTNAKLTNLADGTLSTTSTDAVTGKQLNTTNTNVTNVTNQVSNLTTNITEGKVGPLQRTATADKLTLVADGSDADAPGNAQVIDNLAKGTVNAASKQAVNGSQLYGVSNSVAQALGGGSGVNANGTVKNPTYSIGGTDYTDVGSALTALDGATANLDALKWDTASGSFSAKHGTSNAKITNLADGTLSTTSTDAVTGKQLNATNTNVTNITTNINNGTIGPVQRSTTANTLALVEDSTKTADAPGSAQVLSNLAKGSLTATSTEAVNGSQINAFGTSIANIFGGPAAFDTATGTITGASFTVGGTTYNNIAGAVTSIDNSISQVSNTFMGAGWGVTRVVGTDPRDFEYGSYQVDGTGKITNPSVSYVANTIGTANAQVVFDSGSGNSGYFVDNDRDKGFLPAGTRLSNVADAVADTDAMNLGQFMNWLWQGIEPGQNNLLQQTASLRSGNGLLGAGPGSSGISNGSDLSQGYLSAPFYSQFTGSYQGKSAGSTPATDKAVARGYGAIALGSNAQTAANSTAALAIGVQSYAAADDSVALGSGSVSDETNTVSVGSSGKTSYTITNGDNSKSTVGTAVNTRRIVNMAAGFNATDAVNVSQLKSITDIIGGGSTIDGDGNVTGPTYNIGGNTYNNIEEALDGIASSTGGDALQWDTAAGAYSAAHGTSSTSKITNVAAGSLAAGSVDAVNGGQINTLASNISDVIGGGGSFDPATGKIINTEFTIAGNTYTTIGDTFGAIDTSITSIDNSITNITKGKVGPVQRTATADQLTLVADGGTAAAPGNAQVIDNLANGAVNATSKQAVNGSQLYGVSSSVATAFGGGSTVDANGKVVAPTYTVGTTTYDNVGGAIAALNAGGGASGVDALLWDSTADAFSAKHGTSSTSKITNVADGSLVAGSVDAVNGGQINTLASNISDVIGGGGSFDPTTGKIINTEFTIAGNTYTNIGDTFGAVDSSITNIDNSITNITKGKIGPVQRTATADQLTLVADGGTAAAPGNAQVIDNLANGVVSATSKQAINGSQLYGVSSSISNIIGGGSVVNADGTVSAPTYSVGGTDYTTVGDAITALNNGGGSSSASDALKWDTVAGAYSAAHGSSATSKITNVAGGSLAAGSVDAVNGGQVNTLASNISDVIGGGGSFDPATGKIINTSFTMAGNTYTNIGDTFGSVDNAITNINNGSIGPVQRTSGNILTLVEAGGSAAAPGAAQTLTNLARGAVSSTSTDAINGSQLYYTQQFAMQILGGGAVIDPTSRTMTMPTFKVGANDYHDVASAISALNSGAGTGVDAIFWDSTAGKGTGAFSTMHGGVAAGITNVAAGEVSASSMDAVNGGQLYAVQQGSVQYKVDASGNKTNQVELVGGDPNAPVVLSNVASAVSDTDAVNYGQMKQAIASSGGDLNYVDNRVNSALTESKSYTDYMSQQTLQQANAYTDQKYGQLSQDISKAKTEARQAAAVGLAAASLRYDDRPGKFSTAIGGGAWHGQGAMAMGIGYTSPDGNIRANVSATTAGKNWGVGAGLSFTLN